MFKKLLGAALLMMTSAAAFATVPPACQVGTSTYNPGPAVLKFMAAGSSAMWTTMALGTYNAGAGILGATSGSVNHYVSSSKFTLADNRLVTAFGSGAANTVTDQGTIWIVWDSATGPLLNGKTSCAPHVFAYINLDSVIGNRAFFGKATVQAPASWPAGGGSINAIQPALWGDGSADQTVPANVQALFSASNATNGAAVNAGATDIRPEDAFFASNRVNSSYSAAGEYSGLGYNPNNAAGASPVACASSTPGSGGTLAQVSGTDILGDYPGDSPFHVVAFNILGQDPITCATIPAWSVLPVGAAPIVFVVSRSGALTNLQNATEHQLQAVFTGANVDASAFGLAASPIQAFLREPLSGTMNTTEETVFRHPSLFSVFRGSQETGINGGVTNPINGLNNRWRAIGTGDEVKSVRDSNTKHGTDGIGYAFFSYGNVATINTGSYGYITLNGIEPIFHNHIASTNGVTDPGQPATSGIIPGPQHLPASCAGTFPCSEKAIWAADPNFSSSGLSFPNLRNGSYPAWSTLRLVVNGAAVTGSAYVVATQIITSSNQYAVKVVPDYVPFAAVKTGATVIDPGLQLVRSHFGCTAATCGLSSTGAVNAPLNNPEKGRDAGGSILPLGDIKVNETQDANSGFVAFN